ncbi:hypothetical protein [Paucibacter soli]|uniref:hypothetical protein n=1 Tax=Paucibacter soli TaxID=3133433 RepID=UPI00309D32F9
MEATQFKTSDLIAAIGAGDAAAVIELLQLRAQCNGETLRQAVRKGFQLDSEHASLANLCMKHDQVQLLEHVLAAEDLGLTLDDVLTSQVWRNGSQGLSRRFQTSSLPLEAVSHGCADGVRLAMRLQPGHEDFTKGHDFLGSTCSLHYMALYRGISLGHTSHLACCELLLEAGHPVHEVARPNSPVESCFFWFEWDDENRDRYLALTRKYHAAGALDLNKPLEGDTRSSCHGSVPLAAAIATGNKAAARELILLGADVALATPAEHPDLLSYARSWKLSDEEAMVAGLTDALMHRQIAASIQRQELSPAGDVANIVTRDEIRSTRSRRAGL